MPGIEFGGAYVRRVIDDDLDRLFAELPAVLIDGPRGVGKTTTALQRARTVLRLDDDSQRDVIAANPFALPTDDPPTLLDEWQRVPAVFDAVRRLVDEDFSGGRFLLTGSAPSRHHRPTHSGAGRIVSLRMRPLTLYERIGPVEPAVSLGALLEGSDRIRGRTTLALTDYTREIVMGGFPAIRRLGDDARRTQFDSYVSNVVAHDLELEGFAVRHPRTVLAWLRAYAAATATTSTWETIRGAATSGASAPPARSTTIPYIELLTALRLLDPLEGWLPTNNHLAALTAAPKHHLADPALAAHLVRRSASQLLSGAGPAQKVPRDGPFLGALFESLVALSVRTFAQRRSATTFHLRTKGGRHEVDFIVERADGRVLAIEAKLAASVGDADVRHLLWLRDLLGDDCVDTVVVNTGPEAYRRRDGVAVIPLALLGP